MKPSSLFIFSVVCCLALPAVSQEPAVDSKLITAVDASLKKAAVYLVSKQAADGAWYSEMYGSLREDPSLTTHVVSTLYYLPQCGRDALAADRRAKAFVLKRGMDDLGLPFYYAAAASWVVTDHDKFVRYVDDRQLDADNGWSKDDPQFGGWGYSHTLPKRPKDDGPPGMLTSNISATVYALGAIHHAQHKASRHQDDSDKFSDALTFIERVQNYEADQTRRDARYDDGGFFFNNVDVAMNKAGEAGKDRHGRQRFHSYGSATADGVRALLRCGLSVDHPRVAAAKQWLIKHFDVEKHPGNFNDDREILRQAYFYYYCWSVAHAFSRLELKEIETSKGKVDWAEAMAKSLIAKQNKDGSWTLQATDMKGDDPLVSTPHAAAALAICRASLVGQMLDLQSLERLEERGRVEPQLVE